MCYNSADRCTLSRKGRDFMQVKINESVDSFRVLREGGFYYVDKSLMLKEF